MNQEGLDQLRSVLLPAGYAEIDEARPGLLLENLERVVWAVAYHGVDDLLGSWQDEQAWLVDSTRDRLSPAKTWELYIVLACGVEPDEPERRLLEGVRADTSFSRKLVVPAIDRLTPARLAHYLAPLLPLPEAGTAEPVDALALIEAAAEQEGNRDALVVLSAFRENRPLFEGL